MKLTLEQAQKMMDNNGGSLDLRGANITELPEGITAHYLYLSGCTGLTALPEGITAHCLILGETNIQLQDIGKAKSLIEGEYLPGKYLYADGILTHVRGSRKIGEYTFYIGKIRGQNVVSDGVHYAHCDQLRDGVADLMFKTAEDRGADQYKGLSLDAVVTIDEAVTMYRVITGACRQGSQSFVDGLGDQRKETYTIRECIELTKGQYNATAFERFFVGD